MAADVLLAELRGLGVVLRIDGDRLAYDAPAGVITDEILARVRDDRDGLLMLLRGVLPNMGIDAEQMPSPSERCPWCGPVRLLDHSRGLQCDRCRRLAWVITDRAMTRADYAGTVWDYPG